MESADGVVVRGREPSTIDKCFNTEPFAKEIIIIEYSSLVNWLRAHNRQYWHVPISSDRSFYIWKRYYLKRLVSYNNFKTPCTIMTNQLLGKPSWDLESVHRRMTTKETDRSRAREKKRERKTECVFSRLPGGFLVFSVLLHAANNVALVVVKVSKNMKRRNVECGKLRRPLKRNKLTEGIYGR